MSKKTLIALTTTVLAHAPLREVPPGSSFEIDAAEADRLLERGLARLPDAPAAPVKAGKPTTQAELTGAIAAVMPQLGKDGWTKEGAPDVQALEKALGYDITAAERDAAVKSLKASQPSLFPAS